MKYFQFPSWYTIIAMFLFEIMVPTLKSEVYNYSVDKTLPSPDEQIKNETLPSTEEYPSHQTFPSPDEYLNSVSKSQLRLHNFHRALFDIPVLHFNIPLVNKSKQCAEGRLKSIDEECKINLKANTHLHDLRNGRLTAEDVFDKWCKEGELITNYTAMEKDYTYANLSAFMNYSNIFWRTTTEIGCNGAYNNATHMIVTVCLYYPKTKLKNNYDENLFLPLLVGRTRHKKYYGNESCSVSFINYPAVLLFRLFVFFTLPLIFLIESRRKVQATLSMAELYTIDKSNIGDNENLMTSENKNTKSRKPSKIKEEIRRSNKNNTVKKKNGKRKSRRKENEMNDGSEERIETLRSKEKDRKKARGASTKKRNKGGKNSN